MRSEEHVKVLRTMSNMYILSVKCSVNVILGVQ